MSRKMLILGMAIFCLMPLSFGHNEDILLEMIRQLSLRVQELENPTVPASQFDPESLLVRGATNKQRIKFSNDFRDFYHEGQAEGASNIAFCSGKDILSGPFEISVSLSHVYESACIGFARLEGFDNKNQYIRFRDNVQNKDQFFIIQNNSYNNKLLVSYADSQGNQNDKEIGPGFAKGTFRIYRNFVGIIRVYHNNELIYVHPESITGSVKLVARVAGDHRVEATTTKVSNLKVLRWPQLYDRLEASVSGYGLPLSVWGSCKYNHNGEWILDMTSEAWCKMDITKQAEYAKVYQEGYAAVKELKVEKTFSGVPMRLIPPGRFWMGSPQEEINQTKRPEDGTCFDTETRHRVILSKAYYLGKYEVTKAQWKAVMGESIQPYFTNSPSDAPMENISCQECQTFCQKTGLKLPTEAQWEYACRSGVYGMSYIGNFEIKGAYNAPRLDSIAWYGGNSEVSYEGAQDSANWLEKQYNHTKAGTQSVGKKAPNAFGLYDMIGNVYEWCQDKCTWNNKVETNTYTDLIIDPESQDGLWYVVRGGSWYNVTRYCRLGVRHGKSPSDRYYYLGLRVLSPAD